jgi:hypothetical protein
VDSYARALIKLEVTSPRALYEQIKTYGTSYLTEEVKMSNMCASMVMTACQQEFGPIINMSSDDIINVTDTHEEEGGGGTHTDAKGVDEEPIDATAAVDVDVLPTAGKLDADGGDINPPETKLEMGDEEGNYYNYYDYYNEILRRQR